MLLTEEPVRKAGSFRDPSGFVFELQGRIFRAVDQDCLDTVYQLRDDGLLDRLAEEGLIVRTELVEDPSLQERLSDAYPGYPGFLEHQQISPISYPYEWSATMLADAGVLTLDLQMRLLTHGYSLKDATAYNIQFPNGQPVFIDIPSIIRPGRLDLWIALGQFNRMFTLPLVLNQAKGQSLRAYFLAHLDGSTIAEVRRAFGRLELLKPGLLLDVTLPYLLERFATNGNGVAAPLAEKGTGRAEVQLVNLRRLRAKLQRLARCHKPDSLWTNYAATRNYTDQAQQSKAQAIREFLTEHVPSTVLDLGCNTGLYSMLAAECGASVTAVDADCESIDLLYRQIRNEPQPILPLCVDLANPSPAIGFCNRERESFLDRINVDCVLALAVIHHLHVTANLPVAGIRDLFADLTRRFCVLEFVPTNDDMFRQLIKYRTDSFDRFTLADCIEVFQERFALVRQVPVADSPRTLLFWEKREA